MADKLFDYISASFGVSAALVVAIILGAFWLIHFVTKKITKYDIEHGVLKDSVTKLENNIDSMKQDLVTIRALVETQYNNRNYNKQRRTFSQKHSPRMLNTNGQKLYQDIQGEDFLKEHKDYFFGYISSRNPQTAYDVEQLANLACVSSVTNSFFNKMKDFVYNASSMEITDADGNKTTYDITLSDICFVLSLPLRDMYLSEHPDIKD